MSKVKHLGDMFLYVPKSRADICPADNDAPLTAVTKTERKQPGEQSKEEREQALAECRKRCGIVPGQMAVLKDSSTQLVEQPWMKWTPEEKKKAFDEWV